MSADLGRRAGAVALSALVLAGCDDVWKHYAGGVSGHSFKVADQFVILNNGYNRAT